MKKFITDPSQEEKWDQASDFKCYYCRTDDHGYKACPRMNAMKEKTKEADDNNTPPSTKTSAPARCVLPAPPPEVEMP